jgi:hypothetical protein
MRHPDQPDPVLGLEPRHALSTLAAIVIFVAVGLAWFFLYVQPREEFLLSVAECTGADSSEAAWQRCVEEISSASVRSSPRPPSM